MQAVAAGLRAAGLDARVRETRGVLDITAAARPPGSTDVCVLVDEDGYLTVSWWCPPAAGPAGVVAVIARALAAITGPR
jgi:hypothetical protein